jgi:dephospho-CoA kinase
LTLRVGLTGGIACGKSRVLQRLSAAGFETLDLDRVAHEVMAPGGTAHRDVVEAFGPAILAADGSVDRRRLGDLVFADPAARARLDAIVHPRVREEEARRAALRPDGEGRVVVTDAALLVEAGVHLRFDRLVVVHCAPEQQVRRLMQRDRIDEAAARARVDAQMPTEEKRRYAHIEVDGSSSLAETDRGAEALASELRRLAQVRPPRMAIPLERRVGAMVIGPRRGPRGLDRERVLRDIAAAGGLEMGRVARLLVPPTDRAWYRAAQEGAADTGPETLAAPVALWSLSRSGPDPDFVAAAAASLARLTHTEGAAIAGACLFALALHEALVSGATGHNLTSSLPGWTALARRWGGESPPERIAAAVEAAVRHGAIPSSARGPAPDPAWDELAAGLVGAAIGVPAGTAPPSVLDALAAVKRP